jgi:hypothetical protein
MNQRYYVLIILSFIILQTISTILCHPYITGNAFRDFCIHKFETAHAFKNFRPEHIKKGDTVYVHPNVLRLFFSKIHTQICSPYLLVTTNSDFPVPRHFARFLDDPKIIAWFGQNPDHSSYHEKFYPLPRGLPNSACMDNNLLALDKIRHFVEQGACLKKYKVILNTDINTCSSERGELYNLFHNQPFCFRPPRVPFQEYLTNVSESVWTLSPRGNGLDCYRTWEALILGSIPIVKTSSLDRLFEDLPVLIIDNWSQLTEEFLETKQQDMLHKNYRTEKIFISYWIQLISTAKEKYMQDNP